MSTGAGILVIIALEAIVYFAIYHRVIRDSNRRFDEEMLQKKAERAKRTERPRPI